MKEKREMDDNYKDRDGEAGCVSGHTMNKMMNSDKWEIRLWRAKMENIPVIMLEHGRESLKCHVLGSTHNVYEVDISKGMKPECTCPDKARGRLVGYHCKHILAMACMVVDSSTNAVKYCRDFWESDLVDAVLNSVKETKESKYLVVKEKYVRLRAADICAICTQSIVESGVWQAPFSVCWNCDKAVHTGCLHRMRMSGMKFCPWCRNEWPNPVMLKESYLNLGEVLGAKLPPKYKLRFKRVKVGGCAPKRKARASSRRTAMESGTCDGGNIDMADLEARVKKSWDRLVGGDLVEIKTEDRWMEGGRWV
jgi:hypothetical protein